MHVERNQLLCILFFTVFLQRLKRLHLIVRFSSSACFFHPLIYVEVIVIVENEIIIID